MLKPISRWGPAYFQSGKLSEALDMTERALVLDEEDSRYYALLGDDLFEDESVGGGPNSAANGPSN